MKGGFGERITDDAAAPDITVRGKLESLVKQNHRHLRPRSRWVRGQRPLMPGAGPERDRQRGAMKVSVGFLGILRDQLGQKCLDVGQRQRPLHPALGRLQEECPR